MLKLSNIIYFANKIFAIETVRWRLKYSTFAWKRQDFGAGSRFYESYTKISDVVRKSSSPFAKILLLGLIFKTFRTKKILELGTNIGFTSFYFSLFFPKGQIVTIEGDKILYLWARRIARLLKLQNITFVHSNFDDILPQVLQKYQPDGIFIDGNHRYEPTKKYFTLCVKSLNQPVVLVFDDISWSKQMRRAWKDLKSERVVFKLNLLKFGLIKLKSSDNG